MQRLWHAPVAWGTEFLRRAVGGWEPEIWTKATVYKDFMLGANIWNTRSGSKCQEMRQCPLPHRGSSPGDRLCQPVPSRNQQGARSNLVDARPLSPTARGHIKPNLYTPNSDPKTTLPSTRQSGKKSESVIIHLK